MKLFSIFFEKTSPFENNSGSKYVDNFDEMMKTVISSINNKDKQNLFELVDSGGRKLDLFSHFKCSEFEKNIIDGISICGKKFITIGPAVIQIMIFFEGKVVTYKFIVNNTNNLLFVISNDFNYTYNYLKGWLQQTQNRIIPYKIIRF